MVITNSKEIFGQDAVIAFLKNFMKKKSIPKIIWLTGDSGSGKSTIAEWLALTVTCENNNNGEPCLECKTCKENMQGFTKSIVKSPTIKKINLAELLSKKDVKEVIEQVFDLKTFDNRKTFFIFEEMQELAGQENLFLERMRALPENVYIIGCTTNLKALSLPFQTRGNLTLNISKLNSKSAFALAKHYASIRRLPISDKDINLVVSKTKNNARLITNTIDLMVQNGGDIKGTLRIALNYIDLTLYIDLIENLFKDFPSFIDYIYDLQEQTSILEVWKSLHTFLIDLLYYMFAGNKSLFTPEEQEHLDIIKDNLTINQLREMLKIASKHTTQENIAIQYLIDINTVLTKQEDQPPLTVAENKSLVAEEKLKIQELATANKYEQYNKKEEQIAEDILESLLNQGGESYDSSSINNLL